MNTIFAMAAVRWLIWTCAIVYALYWTASYVLPVAEVLLRRLTY